jgi:hypothetical protein
MKTRVSVNGFGGIAIGTRTDTVTPVRQIRETADARVIDALLGREKGPG